nr:centrosome-associated protein ALMS1 isoform X1 [Oryctolagus cuniculus]
MEPEDLPWPGELEEEEEEEAAAAAAPEETANLDEIVVVEEVEEETRPELNSDFNYEYQRRESTDDDEEDDEAKAWLQAHPGGTLPPPPPPRYRYSEGERASLEVPLTCRVWQQSLYQGSSRTQISDTNAVSLETTTQWGSGDDQKTESWHCLPQETDSSQTLDTSQTRFNVRTEGIEVTDFSSLEESVLSQSENQVKESNRDRDLLCSPLLVIQDNFASPDLPLLTCMTQDQEFGADSLFHQSELEFAPLRGIPDKSEDTEWFSRPSEVSEALFQATSEVASDLVNSYLSISQHPLISTPAAGSQHSLLPPEQENKEESISSDTADEQKTSKDSDNYDAASSYISWKTRKDMQQSETNLVDQVSTSASSEVSEETVAFKRSDSFDASCSHVQFWKQETLQQAETHPTNQDRVSFPHEITPPPPNRMSYSFLRCLLEGRRKGTPLTSDSRYLESVCLRAPAENGVKQNVDSLGGYEGKEDVQKEVSPCLKQKETKNNFLSSEVHPRPSEIPYIGKVIVPDNSVKVSEAYVLSRGHDLSKMEASGGLLQTVKSNLDETSEQLYFEEERNQKATSVFGEKNVDATENVAFEAVIASIESSKDESTVNEISKSLRDDSQEREPKSPCLSPFNYNDENSFFDELKHPCYQSTPGVFEPAASKLLLHKKDDDDSSLYWHPSLKSSPNSFQEILIKPLSVIPELKSPASLSEKSYNQSIGLGKTQSALFQYDMNNEMFLPIGKIKSVSALDLAEKVGSSNDIYSMKVSTSGSLVLQDLKQQTFEEVIESSHCSLGQDVDFSDTTEGLSAAVGSSSSANLVACDAESQGALPLTKDASLTTVGQETLLKADIGQSEIPQPTGVESSFSIHTIMQNDPYFVEGPQGKAASEIITVDDGTECCNPDENAVVCSQRVAELQRETCEQHDVTGECTELAALENLLDDLCDSSQDCQPASQQPSEEESNYQEPVSHSNLGINQSFSSILPPFVPHEPTRESEYHSSNLRMLRVSPDAVPKTLRHLAADASKGGLAEITQSNLKSGITTTPGDSDIGSRLSSSPEDLPQLVVHSQEATAGEHADLLHRKALTDSQLTEEPLKVSAVPVLADQKTGIAAVPSSFYSQREKPGIFYQQALPDSHLTEESLKVSAAPTPTDQKTEKGIVQPSSYSYREKPFYQQTVPDSHLPEEALKVSAASGPADQKTSLPTVTSTSYSQREEPSVFYQQELPESHLTEEAPSVSAAARPADRKTGTPTVASTSYSHGEKPRIFYQQALPESHVPDRTLKFSAVPGPVDQKTGTTTVPSTSYSQRGKPGIFYQQELPDSHQIEEARKFSAALGSADQKTGTTTVPSTTYSQRGKPGILHQQQLPDSHQIEEARKFSAAYGPADQKTIIPTIHSWSEKPVIFYPQALPDRHQTEETLKVSSVSGPADQKTGIPTISSASYSHKEKPSIFYQQTLPDSNKTEEALKGAVAPAPGDQKTGSPAELSSPYSHRKQPILFSQQTLPDSHLPEEGLKVSAVFGSAEQKAEIAAVSSSAYSHRDKSGIVYQQELSDSHLAKEALKVAVGARVADQKTGIPTGSSGSHSQREKPSIFYQQVLPDSHPTEKPLKVSVVPGLVDQNTGIPTVPSGSYSQRQKPVIFYQQTLPDSNIPEEALRVSGVPGPADKTFGIPTVTSTSYSQREKPSIFYQQKLPETSLTEESLKLLAAPRQADQRTGISTASSALYSQREKPGVFYQQSLPGSHLPGESPKVPAAPGSADHKTGTVTVPSSSYSLGEKSIIFYQQPDGHVPEEALNVSASPVSVEQKTGIPTVISPSHSHKGETGIFYQQNVSGSHLLEEALKVSAAPGPADQKVRTSTVSSTSSSLGEKAIIFYEQALPDSHPPEEDLKGLVVSGPTEQKTDIPTLPSSSYSLGEKPIIFHRQALPGSPLTKEALKIVAVPEPADQKSGTPLVSSTAYSLGEKPVIFYQQALSDSQLTKETLKVSAVPGPVDQKTGTPFYSHREKPVISYQQELPDSHPTEKALKVSIVPGPTDPKTGKPVVISASYPHREKPSVSYQQELSDLTEAALKILGVSAPADHKTVVTSTPYSQGEQSIDSYQQQLPDLTEVALKSVGVPGPADQKIEIASPGSYTRKEKSSIVHQQELPGVTKEAVDVFDLPGLSDQKTGIPTGPSVSYTDRQKSKDFHEQALPDSQVTGETLKASAVPGLADQNRTSTVPSSSYQHKEKLKISPVNVLDDQKTELSTTAHSSYSHGEKPKVSTLIGPDDQKPPLLTSFRSSYSQRIKPSILFQQQLPDRDQSGDTVKISTVPEPAEVNAGIPIPLSSSHLHREKPRIVYPQELPNKHLTEDALKLSTVPGPADQKTVLPTTPPSSFSHREKPSIFYPKDLSDRHLTEDALKVSSGLGKVDQITGLPTVSPGTYSHGEKHVFSEHVQRLIDNLQSSDSSVIANDMPLNSLADDRVIINKPEFSGFGDIGSEEIRDTDSSSKTLKEIQTLLMEAENLALKRCNFSAPLVPFRDVSDISFVQSKKVVCFKEPSVTDISDGSLLQRQPFREESPSNKCILKDTGTQTNLKCQRGVENWEFISSTTVRSPLQEAEYKARAALDETLRHYEAAKSVLRSEPEGYSGTIGKKIIIPVMSIIKSDSSTDTSDGNASCSWESNVPESLESVSDVLLNFFPYASAKSSMEDSREEEGVSESDDCGGSIDSLAAHVKNLLQCESSLNHAKEILRNAEEEECRVRARARAWNMKFNLAHECGYSISELNEDDRRKVEEIKAELFGHGRTTDLSKGFQSPQGIGCSPEAVCGHIIIESHEKGCFRTLTAEQPQLDSHPCVFRSAEPSEMIRGHRSASSCTARHISLSQSPDQSNPHFKVWNSLRLESPSPLRIPEDFKISKSLRMPFHEPTCMPPKEMNFHSLSQMLPSEPMKEFTTSITFSSHRHSKCVSDSSILKVGVTESSPCTGASMGVFNSQEENPPRDLIQKASAPSSFKKPSHLPNKTVTILAEGSRQSQKLPVNLEHSHQEEKLIERSDFKVSFSEPSTSASCSNYKEIQFSDNQTLISMDRPSSTVGIEKNVTIIPDLPSHIFLEQRELFEQSKTPHADHHVRKHHSPPSPDIPSSIFLEQRELFERCKSPYIDHPLRESHSLFPQGQECIASDLPSPIFLEQRQSKAPCIDDHMRKHHFPLSQGQDCVVEKDNQLKPISYISNINVEAKFTNVVSQLVPDHCTLATSASTPPSNRKALSCVRITLCPKTPSTLESGALDKRFHSLDPACKTRMNSEFDSDLQTLSSRSLEPTSKLLTCKPVAQNQECLDFLGPISPLDFQVIQSPLPDSSTITQKLKTMPSQNSQLVTSRQIQVNISDLEAYSSPEGTPVSADRVGWARVKAGSGDLIQISHLWQKHTYLSHHCINRSCSQQRELSIKPRFLEESKTPFSGKISSDAVTQITTESPEKTMFSSEIFINAKDDGHEIPEPRTQKVPKPPVRFASSSSVQQITPTSGTDAQPELLPYKPSGSSKMFYVPQLGKTPSFPDSKSDTTIESSHSGSNDAIAPDFPAQVLGTRDDELPDTVNIKHKEGIYSKRAKSKPSLSLEKIPFPKDNADSSVPLPITGDENLANKKQEEEIHSKKAVPKTAQPEESKPLQKEAAGSGGPTAPEHSAQVQDTKLGSLPDSKVIKQKEEIHMKGTIPKKAWLENKESLEIDIAESESHSEFENTTHSVFRSAKFYFHHPVHLASDQDFCHESVGRSVLVQHSWKDFFQHHSDKHREHTYLPPPFQSVDKTQTDYTRVKSLSINLNLGNKEVIHTTKSQARDYLKSSRQINDPKKEHKVTRAVTTQHTSNLNELWNKYQERQKQQKPPGFIDGKELSLVERLDRLAKLLQNPITHSLHASESTQDDSRGERDVREWSGKHQPQKSKLQKKKRYKSLGDLKHRNISDLKKSKVLSHQAGRPSQIKIEQIKFDKYILRKQPGFNYISNTSSESRPSEESELLTDTTTNILSTTTSVDSDILTQTDREVTLRERSSSISTIDTARLIQAFGHERVCMSPRRIKLYSSTTNQQRRYLEKRCKHNKKALNVGHPQMTSEHTRRKRIQEENQMISSDSVSSSAGTFLSSNSTICNKQNVHMLNKGVQAGHLEIVNGTRKHTRDVGVTFPTPSSSEARLEEDSDVTSWSEEKIEEKMLFANYLGDKKLRKSKQNCCEGVSWFVPVEDVKFESKKENLPKICGPGVSWFEPITKIKPWREPLREQNWQGQRVADWGLLAGPSQDHGRDTPRPFVRATLQEALQLHRPDFISRSGERIKRLRLIVQERKLQNVLQSERHALFNAPAPLPERVFLAAQKTKPIGKKEMIQRSKRMYEQLPEVQKKREEEKRRLEYKTYRLRAQLYKKKVTNQLLGRKVPWD